MHLLGSLAIGVTLGLDATNRSEIGKRRCVGGPRNDAGAATFPPVMICVALLVVSKSSLGVSSRKSLLCASKQWPVIGLELERVMRAALKLIRKDGRETSSDDALLEARAPEDDPELAYMKAAYRAAFKTAFQEALESLEGRERTLLKQQIVDGLGIDELGALYDVHRATAARWVAAAREKLLLRTRRMFMLRARISSDECESIMRMVRSQLDVSLHRRLAAD